MTHPLDYYRGKDIAKELLIERINELQNMERNHIESAHLNALSAVLIQVEDVESKISQSECDKLIVGKRYWLDLAKDVSGVCVFDDGFKRGFNEIVGSNPYAIDTDGTVWFSGRLDTTTYPPVIVKSGYYISELFPGATVKKIEVERFNTTPEKVERER